MRFEPRTETGIDFVYQNDEAADRSAILEMAGGGVALLDFDRDGELDVFLPGGGKYSGERALTGLPSGLFRNVGNWRFSNCAAAALVEHSRVWSNGTAVGDIDNDGFPDLLVTGYGGLQFFRNQGDGTFAETAEATGLSDSLWSTSAAFGDVNGDGCLDLYVAHYVDWSFDNDPFCPAPDGRRERCPPQRYEGLPDVLYMSRGDGSFDDASKAAGLRSDGKGLGVAMADFDVDGDLDIYVANDTVPNFLYLNDGLGHFTEAGVERGVALNDRGRPDGSMGIAVGDFNNDGLPDIWVTNYEQESIAVYRNLGEGYFEHVSQAAGVTDVGNLFVGFGTTFFDADRDGDEDAFVTNGHVLRFPRNAPVREMPLLFENRDRGRFHNVGQEAGTYFATPHVGRGVARGDFDRDGDLDLVATSIGEPPTLLVNRSDNTNRWLEVRLIGRQSNRDAVGARLILETTTGRQVRQITGGESYLSHHDRRVFWGIPAGAEIKDLRIEWPSGISQQVRAPEAGQTMDAIEPRS
ncbi:MAG TPA: CRTAC1 family protein [Planctomycetaceae bacterium]|nr:CRTAC1 family protein [Planctomycetaceae bacterium]